jgi:fibronectin-binding autotransporter adhesin
MKTLLRAAPSFKYLLVTGAAFAGLSVLGMNPAAGQSIALSFRFDGQTGAAATTQTLTAGSAGQTYTIDVWVTIAGDASHTNTSLYGLKNIKYRGFSDIASGGGAFVTGATVGYSGNFTGLGAFAGINSTAPKSADTGSTTNGTSIITNPDGISDFGQNSLLSNASQSISNFTFANAAGEIEIAQFTFNTGVISNTFGATTKFFPTEPNTTQAANYTQDGTTSIVPATFTVGSPLTFVVKTQTGSSNWNHNGNGNYSDLVNWDPGQIPDGAGLVATFGNGTTTTVNVPNVTVMVDAPKQVGTLNFTNTNGTSFILGNDGVASDKLTLNNNGAGAAVNSLNGNNSIFSSLVLADNATFNVAGGSSVLVSLGNISETGGASRNLAKTGAGAMTIDTPSTYTGTTSVTAGTLITSPTGTLSTGPLVISSAGGVNSLANLNNSQSVSSLSGTISGAGAATVSVAAGNTLTVAQSTNTTFAGNIALTGAGASFVKSAAGTLETDRAPVLADSSSLAVSGGTLRFSVVAGSATIGTGVTATISSNAAIQLAGTVSALSSNVSPTHRVNISNNSTAAAGLLVTGSSQRVGNVDGSGSTQVNAGGGLTANHIIQTALIIGGTAQSPGSVTIAASDSSGHSLASPAGSQTSALSAPLGAGADLSNPLNGDSAAASSTSQAHAAVPEPSGLFLLGVGGLTLIGLFRMNRRRPRVSRCAETH